jgi:TonB family protein
MALPVRTNRRETSTAEKLGSIGLGLLGTVLLMIVMFIWVEPDRDALAANAPDRDDVAIELTDTGCQSNAMLASTARMAMCISPLRAGDSVEQCFEDAQMMMWMEMSGCEARTMPSAPVAMAMVQPREIEKLTPIDPEPLLEELVEPEKPKPQPQVQQQQPPPPPPPPQQAPPPPQRPQQVVETVKPNNEKDPENARFLSEHSVNVEKQKVARGSTKEPLTAKSKPDELKVVEKPKDDPSMQKPPEMDPGRNPKAPEQPGKLVMRKPGTNTPATAPQQETTRGDQKGGKGPVVSDGFIPRRGDGNIEQTRRDPGEIPQGQGGAGGGQPQVPNLKPSKEALERIAGGGSVDHLEEVESGDETALNAKRWVYASFFNRLKRQVAQNWDPQTVWRRSDPSGNAHGTKTRVTEVRVSLSGKGQLEKIVVTSPSGVSELDDEAVRAFHAAAPFPNPPDGLVKDGKIVFAFSFYFEIGQPRTSWRVIRQ